MFRTATSPHHTPQRSVTKVMSHVLLALVPGTIAATVFFGAGVLLNVLLSVLFAVLIEATIMYLRKRDPLPVVSDLSAVVTAWLFALCLPPLAPWWMLLIGIIFAVVIAKHLYGGLGYNPFNPAMVGYVALLISFPTEMTQWSTPIQLQDGGLSIGDTFAIKFTDFTPNNLDAITGATPLDYVKTQLGLNATIDELMSSPLMGDFSGIGWEWAANFYALGGIYLLVMRIIPWQAPVGLLVGLGGLATVFYLRDPSVSASAAFHIFSGGAMLGAFFIVTDPVSGSTTPLGRFLFGLGVGLFTYIIRSWGGYPDAIAFAVLIMNMAAPMLDHYTQPRVMGHYKEHK